MYSKEEGKYVEKVEFDTAAKKAEEEAATEVLKENYKPTTAELKVPSEVVTDDEDDGLPF